MTVIAKRVNPTNAAAELLYIKPFLSKFYVCFRLPDLLANQIAGPFDNMEEALFRRKELVSFLDASLRNVLMNGRQEVILDKRKLP